MANQIRLSSFRFSNMSATQLINLVTKWSRAPNIIDHVETQGGGSFTAVLRVASTTPDQTATNLEAEILSSLDSAG